MPRIDADALAANLAAESAKPPLQAESAQQAQPTRLYDSDSWFLVPDIADEQTFVNEWLDTQGRGLGIDEQNLMSELSLERVYKRMTLYILARKPVGRKGLRQGIKLTRMPTGEVMSERIDPAELAVDVGVYAPIKAADYWIDSPNRFGAKLDYQPFLNAIGAVAAPTWHVAPLDYGTKDRPPLRFRLLNV